MKGMLCCKGGTCRCLTYKYEYRETDFVSFSWSDALLFGSLCVLFFTLLGLAMILGIAQAVGSSWRSKQLVLRLLTSSSVNSNREVGEAAQATPEENKSLLQMAHQLEEGEA